MRKGSVLLLLGCGLLLGWMTPDLARPGGSPTLTGTFPEKSTAPAALASPAAATTRASRREAWLTGETVLDRQPDGHFYAEVSVESHPARFLVDTGASIVALTAEDAQDMGLEWNDSDLVRIGQGASGPVYGVPVVLDRVELGGFEARQVQAAIVPDGLGVSLLGQSFLSQLRGVEIDGDRMMLGGS
ncbi:retropepsin-like aspartic protease family protein [Novosphingobium album (ex Liu et al. 2023)]|uniref:TIGR02281 family clan AA aspartic protease n=1 Tax=Novosphingobium album (ex Liu et al. 2023) TaxID=3031130 RepID=A0ABT5WQ41_9SPHN|nr:TIGR02281 family clan AA aspartic protease [Novosphingobium album (ex Liu et al. 2023)]MDE8651073.1 TIGR02281 family clan AA aspartic protease [Novosphingobium album (ex Liu et al. 2023)]